MPGEIHLFKPSKDGNAYDTAFDIMRKMRKSTTPSSTSQSVERRLSLVKPPENKFSLLQKFKETAKYLKSPLFSVQMILFAIGNVTVSLSLNVVNGRDPGSACVQVFVRGLIGSYPWIPGK